MNEWLPRTGSLIFAGTMLLACGAAVAQVLEAIYLGPSDNPLRNRVRRHLIHGFAIAALLAAAQIIFLTLCYTVPWMRPAAGIGYFYLGCTVPLPFLWAAGQIEQQRLAWPTWSPKSLSIKRLLAILGLILAGVAVAMVAFNLGGAQPGASVQEMSRRAQTVSALAVMAIWLMINAPWIEEIVFRHYLLPRLARTGYGQPAAVAAALCITSVIFALGHAGHTIPIWPKLIQMVTWGIALGAVRIWLGTLYAIGLHLIWNLAAPLIAMAL